MNRPNTITAVVSAAGIAFAAGCGTTQPRTSSNGSPGSFSTQTVSYDGPQPGESPLFTVPTYSVPIEQLTVGEIAAELEAMASLDRDLVNAAINERPDSIVQARINEADAAHAERLGEIVDQMGWPTAELVGPEAAQGAFLVVQHAGHDTAFQNKCLGLMVDLVNDSQLPAPYVALLTDRIRMFKGQAQLFGTQMTFEMDDEGQARAIPSIPIEDISNLDTRRAMMNMPPHDQFAKALESQFANDFSDADMQSAAVETWSE
ncbi:MAG: hypothetical protein DHS20C14_22110 [Phycisphaeraceae bacterium]|nr:MAG: hypothetical protein DHS20C14_22110 [Phycisphaeraceae bacterium]